MPRKIELTWQPGSGDRKGRWRKKYKGRVLYFAYGSSKSDVEDYKAALEEWKSAKATIDEEEARKPRLHAAEYQTAMEEWSLVLQWSRENADQGHAELAQGRLEQLKQRLNQRSLEPLRWGDRLNETLSVDPAVCAPVLARLQEILPASPSLDRSPQFLALQEEAMASLDGSPERIATEIWADRLDGLRRRNVAPQESVGANVQTFLAQARGRVAAKEVSAGRYDPLRIHITHFQDWIGAGVPVSSITSKILLDYHAELLHGVSEKKLSPDYAKDRMNAVKQYVQWLWQIDAIRELPRILMDRKALRISKRTATPEVFSIDEVKKLVAASTERTKLYLLLMLNCGMTQKDISDLRQDEVDWRQGTITRKRSKTAKHENVPVVRYKLWPKTRHLLEQARSSHPEYVLTNQDGGPLKVEELRSDGRLRKIDNIATAFNRLRRTTKIAKPLKAFKKTSATLVRGSKEFSGVEDLFLGHAPRRMSDRHYAQVPQDLLDEAIAWLGRKYALT